MQILISSLLSLGEGAGFDYTVSTTQVRFLYRRPDPPDDVVVIFRVDDIAQESNETFTLELNCVPDGATLPTGSNVFFRNTINMTIIDSDGKKKCYRLMTDLLMNDSFRYK